MSQNLLLFICCLCLIVHHVESGKDKSNESKESEESLGSCKKDNQCYDDCDRPYVYFATKTAYRWNRNKDDDEIKPKGCVARQFWLLSRHGTRNPGTEDMEELRDKLPQIREKILNNHFQQKRGSLCKDDLENLQEWIFRANVTEDKFLVKEGHEELEDLGDRFQDRFSSLLTRPFTNESYIFQYTDSQRTEASAKAFAKGMFGKRGEANVFYTKSPKKDALLRFYKSCKKWKQEVDDNPEATKEKQLFEESVEFHEMIKGISTRLGFTPDQYLNISEIDLMYNMCSFDKAWRPKKLSPWCAVFTQNDLEILEYREDLEYYYEDGYGFPVNYEQACPTVKNLYDNFRQAAEESSSTPKGIFYFTHSGTLLKVLSRLGLFEDKVPLKHSNRLQVANREWRTSLIDSFASNLAFVLFKCSESYKVSAYVQERPVKLPGCADYLCDFSSSFSEKYGPISNNCNLDDICRI